ncbi:MAG TPA: hypothetical protein VE843_05085, partial [Ktedonobacteraceae bacterium]|nr:hypothetical protein [Ktedonobacteraceae bacterium]
RANDGFNDGSNAARTDTTFNPACYPLGIHTSDGQHTTIYCNAWAQGYTSTWDSIHGQDQTPTQNQFQQQRQTQYQHGNCIALSCNIIQGGSQGQDQGQENSQGNTGP